MKKCKSIEKLIQKFLDGEISNNEREKLILHTKECEKCKKEFEGYINLFSKLKNIKEQPIPTGFESRLHYKLTNYMYRKPLFYTKLLPALGVAFVMFIVMTNIVIQKTKQQNYSYLHFYSTEEAYRLTTIEGTDTLPLYTKGNLRIKLKTNKEIKNVEVSINIPQELCIDKKQRIIKWRGDLKPGENYLILNIIGSSIGVYPVDIKIKQDSKEKIIKTSLKIT